MVSLLLIPAAMLMQLLSHSILSVTPGSPYCLLERDVIYNSHNMALTYIETLKRYLNLI